MSWVFLIHDKVHNMNTLVYFDFDHMNSIACSVRNLNLQPRQANESFLLSKPSADRNAEKWKQIQKYHLSRSGARFKRPVVHAVEEKSSLKNIYLY